MLDVWDTGLTEQWQYLVPIFSTCCSKQLYRSVLLRCSSASSSPKKRQSSCSGVSWGQLTWQETGRRSEQDPFFGRRAEHENATGRMDLGLAALRHLQFVYTFLGSESSMSAGFLKTVQRGITSFRTTGTKSCFHSSAIICHQLYGNISPS